MGKAGWFLGVLALAGVLAGAGCGVSPREDHRLIRSLVWEPAEGDGSRIALAPDREEPAPAWRDRAVVVIAGEEPTTLTRLASGEE